MFAFLPTTNFLQLISEDYAIAPYIIATFVVFFLIEWFRRSALSVNQKHLILMAASILLIGYIDTRSLILMSILAAPAYFLSWMKLDFKKHILLFTGITVLLLILSKSTFANWTPKPIVIVGLSYFVFRIISVIIEIGRKNPLYLELKPLTFFAYIFFFPIFLAGPIQKYADFRPITVKDKEVPRIYFFLVLVILFKLMIVDYLLLQAVISPMRSHLVPVVKDWSIFYRLSFFFGHGLVSFVYHYFDFVVYTEIAKSIGRLLGYHVVENFNYPLLATNIGQFWRRWHISLMEWVRDYIFMPVMVRSRRFWLGTYTAFLVIGLWHTMNLNWLLWGLAHASALVLYNLFRRSVVYEGLISNDITRRILGFTGWIAVLLFLGAVNNLVTFSPNYTTAITFISDSFLGS